MVLTTGPGEPKGAPANCAHRGFINNDNWKLEDGMWVRDEDSDTPSLEEFLEDDDGYDITDL